MRNDERTWRVVAMNANPIIMVFLSHSRFKKSLKTVFCLISGWKKKEDGKGTNEGINIRI